MNYAELNQYIPAGDRAYGDAWRRVLGRLGDYTGIIVRELNLRPTAVALIGRTAAHVLVRITLHNVHVVLRIAPEADLASEVFFGRTMAAHQLPAAQIIHYNLTRASLPFAYTIESYVCGTPADQIGAPEVLRAAARQAGRALRRMHRVEVRGWGQPTTAGRWPTSDWAALLDQIHRSVAAPPTDALLFGAAERALAAALIEHPALRSPRPALIHGALRPGAVRCTLGEHVQLEALVDPGRIVAADPMLDLAWALDPYYPAAWRAGLLEGYTSLTALSAGEAERLHLLRALTSYWSACYRYFRAQPHEAASAEALALMSRLHDCGTTPDLSAACP